MVAAGLGFRIPCGEDPSLVSELGESGLPWASLSGPVASAWPETSIPRVFALFGLHTLSPSRELYALPDPDCDVVWVTTYICVINMVYLEDMDNMLTSMEENSTDASEALTILVLT